jgi:hypothetical protein
VASQAEVLFSWYAFLSLPRHLFKSQLNNSAGGVFILPLLRRQISRKRRLSNQIPKLTKDLQNSTPEPNEALKWLKSTATSYAAFVPGGKSYVDSAFKDLETVQQNHSGEVEEIVNETYNELKKATKTGVSIDTAVKTWDILQDAVGRLGELAKDSAEEVLDNHPQLKEKFGGSLDQLKNMADSYGPEGKKELKETYTQIKDVLKGGVSAGSLGKVQQLIQEKSEKMKKYGDEAWKKGLEKWKPYLEKKPEVKKFIEENMDSLKQGNLTEVFEQIRKAVEGGGSVEDLKRYVKDAGEKAKDSGLGLGGSAEELAKMIPGGSEILPKLQKLQEVVRTRGDEAEGILKGTYKDIQDVLQRRISEAEKLAEKAGQDK